MLQEFEKEHLKSLNSFRPAFASGDTVRVGVILKDKDGNERVQNFEGVCIYCSNGGISSGFLVRKIASNGEGVERFFPLYSPSIKEIVVIRRGKVRQSRIFYMRKLRGKAARIREKKGK